MAFELASSADTGSLLRKRNKIAKISPLGVPADKLSADFGTQPKLTNL
jgi:hypothetical protein